MESLNLEEVQEYMESQKIKKKYQEVVLYYLDYWGQKEGNCW